MKLVLVLIGAMSLGGFFSPLLRPSNSKALAEEGLELWDQEEFAEAAHRFEQSRELRTTAESTFDLGTALVGAGEHQRGEQILNSLVGDDRMAAASWYNTGNSRLDRGAVDEAIDAYTQALRIEPSNISAKRNLEIALRRRAEQQQESGPGSGDQDDPQGEPSPGEGEPESESLDPDLERVLRSIDQQEREELSRMRRAKAIQMPADW